MFNSNFNLYGSILFLTCLSEFHYVVVVHPLRAAQVQRESWAVIDCSAVWFISMLEIPTMVYMTTVEKTENVIYCSTPSSTWLCTHWLEKGFTRRSFASSAGDSSFSRPRGQPGSNSISQANMLKS